MALTDTAVRNAKPGFKPAKDKEGKSILVAVDGPYKLFDERGLFLLVTPAGGKWWRLRYKFDGKEKLLSLGVYPDVGLKDARTRRDDARKLLDSASSEVKKLGIAKAAASFNDPRGKFVHDDLYVFAVNLQSGKFEAHGMSPKWVGTNASDLQDVEGKPLIKEMLELAKTKGEGTVDYVWRNPVTNAVEKKRTFIRRENGSLIGVGFYSE